MIILGIDPGYAIIGYGVVEESGGNYRPIAYGAITTTPQQSFSERLKTVYDDLSFIIQKYKPEAVAIEKLLTDYGMSRDEICKKLGKAPPTVSNKLRLLRLPEEIRLKITQENLTERHARALLRLSSESEQVYAARRIADLNLGVKQADELVDRIIKKGIDEKPTEKVMKSISDVRVFFKTITKAISLMNDKGIEASEKKEETDNYYECTIRITK